MKLRFVRLGSLCCRSLAICGIAPARAEREPVLKQIQVPHPYYYREMYLPQVTSGPDAAAWSPDGTELVYAMQGSLWRQKLGSTEAVQLTDGPGYDNEPDWSPDGKRILYTSYRNDALELWVLELATGKRTALVANGAANLDARWSPDGSKVAYVSTAFHGRFHVFVVGRAEGSAAGRGRPHHGRARQRAAPLLLLEVRPVPLPHLVPRREGADPRLQPGRRLGLGRSLADGGAARRRDAHGPQGRDQLEGPAGLGAGRKTGGLQLVPRPAAQPALADDGGGRRPLRADLLRVRPHAAALVSGRPPHRVRQQRGRERLVARRHDPGRRRRDDRAGLAPCSGRRERCGSR